ncbi:response regulator [Mycobacterium sp. CVI_P3]|uniref:Response regulator n=1 Tax=Mycobacterium pinniadriaticum TaxID=2994102 RepID=A0ABT3SE02_9MYCO|nr:response regulator [Mycobacterium pinniadriaticum]MCX2931320.1 response regulator [Mycobacterium pinniadriaticum]MCX2937744.1 response regulator [Mycobacterium pinniadriaticum]
MTHTIVIFEDDAFLLDAYQLKLSANKEWQAITFPDGESALQRIKDARPDIVVLDLLMPKRSGIEILKEMRADPETIGIPVIVASNLGQKDIVNQALELGAKDYFIKSETKINDILRAAKKYL